MDALAPVAELTRRLPRPISASIGWHIGERAARSRRVAKLRHGGRVVVDIGDYVHRPMYFMGEYELATTRLFERLACPGWTVLDIGANVGYFAVVAARAGGPGSRVAAFEPNPAIGEMLAGTARLNPDLDIRVEHTAVGDVVGELDLHISSESRNSGLSSLRGDLPNTEGGTMIVNVTTVDTYCENYGLEPDIIKIDVEGFEHEVLVGAERTLRGARPRAVICEFTPERDDPAGIIAIMDGHGYAPHSIADDGELTAIKADQDVDEAVLAHVEPDSLLFYNVCFTPR